ncbi:MAG: elongation factor P maturation arginine rhamnosyltransferase EarP [Treponema sp.]|nr:elongation factor P maturation arginine rhamnosyltransferase EarP [Treponema sp.]
MNKKYSDVTILCRVVDNYGDIGFVYRLSRSLSELSPELKLRLVVSNLESFASMAHGLDPNKAVQEYRSWTVLDWNADDACRAEYTKNPPSLILECFQCSRPEWLDDILFEPGRTQEVQIINIEYLTAEDWADDFHLLKSGTRSALVKKVNFMPGFTEKTGGLVIDNEFASSLRDKDAALFRLKDYPEYKEIQQAVCAEDVFCVSLFTYKRDLSPIVRALKKSGLELCVFVAPGLSRDVFMDEWNKEDRPFKVIQLPYMAQESWDALLTLMDLNIIRGEDSFARACLCGKPFLWNAYVQDEELQLVKVGAVLDRMECHFAKGDSLFQNYRTLMLEFNRTQDIQSDKIEESMLKFLGMHKTASECFAEWGKTLLSHGNPTEKLLDFIRTR